MMPLQTQTAIGEPGGVAAGDEVVGLENKVAIFRVPATRWKRIVRIPNHNSVQYAAAVSRYNDVSQERLYVALGFGYVALACYAQLRISLKASAPLER